MSLKFKCTQCGACCRLVGLSTIEHNLPVRDDGSCGYFVDNKCSIYDDRPDYCRVDKMGFNDAGLDRVEYYKESNKACNKLIDYLGLDEKFKIDYEREYANRDAEKD